MEAISIGKTRFNITEFEQLRGEIIYESLFSKNAEIKIGDDLYKIKPTGIFETFISVTRNEKVIVKLKMNWRGKVIFDFIEQSKYIMKIKDSFYNKYTIENEEGKILIQFDPKFNWNESIFIYDITYYTNRVNILLVILGIYVSNHFIASMSGAIPLEKTTNH